MLQCLCRLCCNAPCYGRLIMVCSISVYGRRTMTQPTSLSTVIVAGAPNGILSVGSADGSLSDARFSGADSPYAALCFASELELVVADSSTHKVRVVDLGEQRVWTLAGSGQTGLRDGR